MNRAAGSAGLLPGIALATIAQAMDAQMISGLLPTIEGALALTPDEANALIIGYLCTNIVVIPISPWLSEYFGRRRYFLMSIAGFGICALLCACCSSFEILLALRILQGAFGGGLVATSHAAFRRALPSSHLGISQVAFVGSFIGAPLTFGPLISGVIYDGNHVWQWMFAVDAILAAVSFLLCWKFFDNGDEGPQYARIDLVGIVLFSAFAIPLQYVFIEGARYNWLDDPNICTLLAASALSLIALIIWHVGDNKALFSAALRLNRNTTVVAILLFFLGLCLSGIVAVAIGFAEQLLDFTATLAGAMMVLRGLAFIPLILLVGILMDKKSPRVYVPVAIGIVLIAVGFILQWQWTTTDTSFTLEVQALTVSGLGIGPALIPLLWWLFKTVPKSQTLAVTAFVDTALALGTRSALAVVPTAIDHRFAMHYNQLSSEITATHLTIVKLAAIPHSLALLTRLVAQQSYALAFADIALGLAVIAIITIPFIALVDHTEAVEEA